MVSLPWISALALVAALSSTKAAVEAVAEGGDDARAGVAYLRAKGRPGLWAVNAAAKRERGERRVRLLAAMGRLPFEGAEWALRDAYRQGDADSRLGAVQGLSQLPGPGPRRVLLEAAEAPERPVRIAAARGLGRSVDAVRDELAARAAASSEGLEVALIAAAVAPDSELAAQILPAGLEHPQAEVRRAALELMQSTGAASGVSAARRIAVREGPDMGVLALRALAAVPDPARYRWIAAVLADPTAPSATRDAAFERLAAAEGAGFGPLLAALARTDDAELRLRRGLPRPVPAARIERWVEALGRPEPKERAVAEAALAVIGPPAYRPLIARLADPDPATARRALAFLLSATGDDLDAELERAARADDPRIRAGAVAARIRRTDGAGAERYASALDDASPLVRTAAGRSLAAVAQPAADEIVVARAGTDGDLDTAFLQGAAERRDTAFRHALALRLLSSPDGRVRREAIEALRPVDEVEVLNALLGRLKPAPLDEKYAIMDAVATSPLPEAATTMIDLVTHVDPEVRTAAQRYVAER